MKSFNESASLNAISEAMEAETISKNGASLKSQRVGINFTMLVFTLFAFVFTGCKEEDREEQVKLPDYIAVNDNLGDQIDFAILGLDGSGYFYEFKDENPNMPQRLSIYDGNKEEVELIVNFDEEGLPKNILSENFTIVLGNYEGNKFNAVVITKDGESQIFENIETDVSWDEYERAVSYAPSQLRSSTAISLNPMKWINTAVSAVGCALSIAAAPTGIGIPLTAISCVGAIADIGDTLGWWETPEIVNDVSKLGNYASIIKCAKDISSAKPLGVLSCVADLADWMTSNIEYRENSSSENVNLGDGVLKTGNGNVKITLTWDNYADIDVHCIDPAGSHIYFADRYSSTGGFLDYDNRVAYGPENIYFSPAPVGTYRVYLHYYNAHSGISSVNYKVVIFENNRGQVYEGIISGQGSNVEIATFTVRTGSNSSSAVRSSNSYLIDWNNLPKK